MDDDGPSKDSIIRARPISKWNQFISRDTFSINSIPLIYLTALIVRLRIRSAIIFANVVDRIDDFWSNNEKKDSSSPSTVRNGTVSFKWIFFFWNKSFNWIYPCVFTVPELHRRAINRSPSLIIGWFKLFNVSNSRSAKPVHKELNVDDDIVVVLSRVQSNCWHAWSIPW